MSNQKRRKREEVRKGEEREGNKRRTKGRVKEAWNEMGKLRSRDGEEWCGSLFFWSCAPTPTPGHCLP